MAEYNFDEFFSRLIDTSEPLSGDDVLKIFLDRADLNSLSNTFNITVAEPLFDNLKNLYSKVGNKILTLSSNDKEIKKMSDPLALGNAYENNQRKIREKLSTPILQKLEALYNKVGEEINSDVPEKIAAMADPSGILEIRETQKKKLKEILNKSLSKADVEAEKIVLGGNDILSDGAFGGVAEWESDKKSKQYSEQKTFDQFPIFSLSDETIKKFETILNPDGKKDSGDNEKTNTIVTEKEADGGFFSTVLKLLGLGAVISAAVLAFWPEIKKWTEEKFGKTFDSFKGIFENISKWFTLGSMGAGAALLKIKGEVFENLGELLSKSVSKIFVKFFGEGADTGIAFGVTKVLNGATFAKLAGSVLKGMSKTLLKGIPIIGSLFSFWFAYDSFKEGDFVGGMINVASGIANLLNFVIPGIGTGLSLGIDVLGTILDVQAGEGTGAERSAKKLDILIDWAKSLGGILRKIPMVESLVDFGEGFVKLFSGDVRGGLQLLNKVPFVGMMAGTILAIYDAATAVNESGRPASISEKMHIFFTELKKRIGISILAYFPSAMGIRGAVANLLGIEDAYRQDDYELNMPQNLKEQQNAATQAMGTGKGGMSEKELKRDIEKLEAQIIESRKKYEENENSWFGDHGASKDELGFLERELKKRKDWLTAQNSQRNNAPAVKVDDLFLGTPDFSKSKQIYDPSSNTQYSLSPDDNVMAYKKGGAFDETLQDIKKVIMNLHETFIDFQKTSAANSGNNYSINNVSSVGDSSKTGVVGAKRDPIFENRLDYLRKHPLERSFA